MHSLGKMILNGAVCIRGYKSLELYIFPYYDHKRSLNMGKEKPIADLSLTKKMLIKHHYI